MLGNLTVVPIKVPQVSSLHRLSGQTSTVLPQVQPKSGIPASLLPSHSSVSLPREQPASLLFSHSPVSLPREQPASLLLSHSSVSLPREQPASLLLSHSPVSLPQEQPASQKQSSCQALSLLNLQRATAVVSPKSHAHSFNHTHSSSHTLTQSHTLGPALPTANSTFSPERRSIGQGDTATFTTSSPPPLAQTLASPLGQTLASPLAQTLASPLAQTLVSPLGQTLASPLAQTLASPLAQTLASPLAQTLASPLAQTQSLSPQQQPNSHLSLSCPRCDLLHHLCLSAYRHREQQGVDHH
uniref:coiled-coil domain-containing protein 8 homolog n=1 Tax=Oncorhynchus gorbuscha TaxID=8017 RepID=UPI001EAF0A55|nr:coiled-coil domain-containing protein 8 homolog [Oncorhynchus gorbuscha]